MQAKFFGTDVCILGQGLRLIQSRLKYRLFSAAKHGDSPAIKLDRGAVAVLLFMFRWGI